MGRQKSQKKTVFQKFDFLALFIYFLKSGLIFFSGRHLYLRVQAKKQNRSSKYGSDFDIFPKT